MCPECGSDNVSVVEYDFGRCPETGYHDAGERYECHDCGAYGDADELEREGTQIRMNLDSVLRGLPISLAASHDGSGWRTSRGRFPTPWPL